MNLLPRLLICALCLTLLLASCGVAQEKAPAEPPTPAFQTYPADSTYTCGQVRLMYVGPHPNFYFTLSVMPEGVDYFHLDITQQPAALQLKTIQLAAEHGWHVGVFHQPRLTTNVIKSVYVTAHIPATNDGEK